MGSVTARAWERAQETPWNLCSARWAVTGTAQCRVFGEAAACSPALLRQLGRQQKLSRL